MSTSFRITGLFLTLIAVAGMTVLCWYGNGKPVTGIDDSDIYLRYAENAAAGHGYVYNPGGEKVEGFTSAVWMGLVTAVYMIFPGSPEPVLVGICVLMLALSLWWLIACIIKTQGRGALPWAAALVMIALLTPGFLEWNILVMMDTCLWTLLLVFIGVQAINVLYGAEASTKGLLLAFAVLPWARPESLLYGPVLLTLFVFVSRRQAPSFVAALRSQYGIILSFFISLALLLALRLWYFGYLFPNTYYAKVSGDLMLNLKDGMKYIVLYLIQNRIHLLGFLALLASLYILLRKKWHRGIYSSADQAQMFLCMLSLANFSILLYTGGDFFPLSRFMQSLEPLFLLMLFHVSFWKINVFPGGGLRWSVLPAGKWGFAALLTGFVYFALTMRPLYLIGSDASPLSGLFQATQDLRTNAEGMNHFFDRIEKPSVGATAAGAIAYRYEGKVIDLLGLNHTAMAHADKIKQGPRSHASFNKDVFYREQPDLLEGFMIEDTAALFQTIREGDAAEVRTAFNTVVLKGIYYDEKFQQQYQYTLAGHPSGGKHFCAMMHINFIEKLRMAGYTITPLRQYWLEG